ncbi:MAG: Gfo/Idh/MocA family protein [Arachnia sp.]
MEPLRTAVIGMGAIGIEHAEIYQSIAEADLVAVVDAQESTAAMMGQRFGVPAWTSLAALLESGIQLDAASLCTPDDRHFPEAMALIEARLHLLIEKPIATRFDEARALTQAADAATTVTMPGHTLRFEPRYYTLAQAYRGGALGELVHGYLRRNNRSEVAARANGRVNVSWFLGIHDIDALLWVTGLDVVEVQAMATNTPDASQRQCAAVIANLRLNNGNVVQLESAWALPGSYPTDLDSVFRIVGTRGEANVETFESGMRITGERFSYPMTAGAALYGRTAGALHEEISCFVRACHHGAEPPVTMAQAAQAVRVVCAIDQAVITGAAVRVEDVR